MLPHDSGHAKVMLYRLGNFAEFPFLPTSLAIWHSTGLEKMR
jgi:hypothetical protein